MSSTSSPGAREPAHGMLHVSSDVTADDLREVLADLKSDSCAHTWVRYAHGCGGADRIIDAENALRPTTFFAYFSEANGSRELVAIATVADRIHNGFIHDGIPVLARCVVRPAFRGLGYYREILEHRIGYCETRWGHRLRAIHLGTAAPKILGVARRHGFVAIGEQHLADGKQVQAMLRFTRAFASEIAAGVERRRSPRNSEHPSAPAVRRMQRLMSEMLTTGFSPRDHLDLRRVLDEIRAKTAWTPAEHPAIAAVTDLFHAIPLREVA